MPRRDGTGPNCEGAGTGRGLGGCRGGKVEKLKAVDQQVVQSHSNSGLDFDPPRRGMGRGQGGGSSRVRGRG